MLPPRCLDLLLYWANPDHASPSLLGVDFGDCNEEFLLLRREGLISVGEDPAPTLEPYSYLTWKGLRVVLDHLVDVHIGHLVGRK